MAMSLQAAALVTVWRKLSCRNTYRNARVAVFAVGAISHEAAAAKALVQQLTVDFGVNPVWRRGDHRSGLKGGKVAARVARGAV